MKTLFAFMKKELLGHIRTGKLYILLGVFVLIGIMNPVTAKLTPWLPEMLEESMEAGGISMPEVSVTALDSWVQFYKNLLMGVIAFVVVESSIFTKEYSSGSLILSLTKGLERYKVLVAKAVLMVGIWTVGYAVCFGITYFGSEIFWDNSIAQNLMFSVLCYYLFGLWLIALIILCSALFKSSAAVLLTTGGVAFGLYLVGALPKIGDYLPTKLASGTVIVYGLTEV